MSNKYADLNKPLMASEQEEPDVSTKTQAPTYYIFGSEDAVKFLMQLDLPEEPIIPIPENIKMIGLDGFPYVSCELRIDYQLQVSAELAQPAPTVSTGNPRGNFIQSLLNEGYGMTLWQDGQKKPTWVYQYRDLLCFKLFGSLQPPPEFDETLHSDKAAKPILANTQAKTSELSEGILPGYALNVLRKMIKKAGGESEPTDLHLVNFPEIDGLTRLAIPFAGDRPVGSVLQKISQAIAWCLPYFVIMVSPKTGNSVDSQQKASSEGPHIVQDYVTETEEKFVRIYDADSQPMVDGWVYPQNFRSDQELADQYAYLNHKTPHVCEVTTPPGIRILGWAASNSTKVYIYRLQDAAGIRFFNDRPLPKANPPQQHTQTSPRPLMEYKPDKETHFVCVYDEKSKPENGWLIPPEQAKRKTPEQLKESFNLPFVPFYTCDAVLPVGTKIVVYATGSAKRSKLYRAESGATFSNERPL